MSEPFYIRQSREERSTAEIKTWFLERKEEAKAKGARVCRFSYHPDDPMLLLIECWAENHVPDQGSLRWNLNSQ